MYLTKPFIKPVDKGLGRDFTHYTKMYDREFSIVDRSKKIFDAAMILNKMDESVSVTEIAINNIGNVTNHSNGGSDTFVPREGRFGDIYFIPRTYSSIVKLNTQNDTVSYLGSFDTTHKWIGGNRFERTIFGWPLNRGTILAIDVDTDQFSEIIIPSNLNPGGIKRFYNRHPNGFFYTRPQTDGTVYVFDPVTRSMDQIITNQKSLTNTNNQYVLASDGCLYTPPTTGRFIHKFNPKNNHIDLIDVGSTSSVERWVAGIEAPNKCIYWAPYVDSGTGNREVLKYNLKTGEVSIFGDTIATNDFRYLSAAVDLSGYVYFFPGNAMRIIRLDPSTDEITTYATIAGTTRAWNQSIGSDNGCHYVSSHTNTNSILKVKSPLFNKLNPNLVTSNFQY